MGNCTGICGACNDGSNVSKANTQQEIDTEDKKMMQKKVEKDYANWTTQPNNPGRIVEAAE